MNKLPYRLPKNIEESKYFLSEIISIPKHYLTGDTSVIIAALSGTILYRHLDRQKRIEVMKIIHQLDSQPLKSRLIAAAVDPLIVPQWGEWSLTNAELSNIIGIHNEFNRWSSLIGANPGAYGIGGSVWSMIKTGVSRGNFLVFATSLVLMGVHEFSYDELQRYGGELERRKFLSGASNAY